MSSLLLSLVSFQPVSVTVTVNGRSFEEYPAVIPSPGLLSPVSEPHFGPALQHA